MSVTVEENAEDLYENAPCGYLTTLPDGTVARVNRTLLEWMGHSRDELLGRRFVDLLTPGGRIYHETHYAPLLRIQGAVREIAFDLVCADGTRLPALVNSTLRTDADGGEVAIRTTVFDATDRREYERELLRARDREQQARERAEALQSTMARLAEENAVLYEREREIARKLQASLLAGEPPRDRRLLIASHYAPAGDGSAVGGDWHDAIRLDADRIALVVGDVVGRGIDAAATMGQLRSAVRALAGTGLSPAALLDRLDAFVEHVEAAWMATVAYVEVGLGRGELRYACAGHPPPLIAEPGLEPQLLWDGRSPPLGARDDVTVRGEPPAGDPRDGGARAEGHAGLVPGGRLLLVTDGLVEQPDCPLDTGLARLVAETGARRALPLERLVDELPRALTTGGDDDVCLLAAELAAP